MCWTTPLVLCYTSLSASNSSPINVILKNLPRLIFLYLSGSFEAHVVLQHMLIYHIFLTIPLLMNPTSYKKIWRFFLTYHFGVKGGSSLRQSLGCGMHTDTILPNATQHPCWWPPSAGQEHSSLLTKTCCFLFLIFHMLLSVRCHLIIVLINISLNNYRY